MVEKWRKLIFRFCPSFFAKKRWIEKKPKNKNSSFSVGAIVVFFSKLLKYFLFFSVYITWMWSVIMYFVPFISLAVLNCRIYCQIRKSQAERSKLTRHQQREIGMATMLLGVVVVFFICNILALVVNVLEVKGAFLCSY